MKRLLILTVFFLWCSTLLAVEGKPRIRRICLDRATGRATITWTRPTDNCASFQYLNIFGREDAISPFILVGNSTDFNLSSFVYQLPNFKDWQFFVVYSKACNGIDSIISDTIAVDLKEPPLMELDSVSVDLATQNTIMGWAANSAADTKGYFVYYITVTNQLVGDTGATSYSDLKKLGNPANGASRYSIAAYDSCGNTSPIGNSHSTIFLRSNTDICSKQIRLSWTAYVGWPKVDSYDIYVNKNNTSYVLAANISGDSLRYNFAFNSFGDNYCFFVRAHKQGSAFTSSSNRVCENTNAVVTPTTNYIARVTVKAKIIDVICLFDNTSSAQKLYLERSINGGAFSLINTYTAPLSNLFTFTDASVDVQKNVYAYRLISEGPCDLKLDTSNTSNSILLKLDATNQPNNDLSWNDYLFWLEGTEKYELLYGDADNFGAGSTWNTASSYATNPGLVTDTRTLTDLQKPLCYCVLAVEPRVNAVNRKDSSYSNITCLNGDPIVYFPNAFRVGSDYNKSYYPKGAFLDYQRSAYSIYNRWGQKVYETNDASIPWDGNDKDGNPCQQEVYLYTGKMVGLNGKEIIVSGTLTLLR